MNVSTVSTSSVSRGGKLLRIFLSLVLIIGLMPSLGAMSVEKAYAAAVDTVTIVMKDSTGETKTLATWTYDETNATYNEEDGTEVSIVEDFSGETEGGYVYTGINRKPDPRCIAVCSKGITVENLYKYAGALLNEKTGEGILKSDDVKLSFGSTVGTHSGIQDTYNGYWGKTRYYYPKWYTAETYSATVTEELQAGAVEAPTTLAITSFHSALANDGKKEVSELLKSADQENALRVLISQEEGGNATDINLGTNSTKNVSYIEFVSPNKTFSDLGLVDPEPEPESWYSPEKTELTIKTAEELAEFAQIVNGTHATYAQDSFRGKTVTLADDIDLGGQVAAVASPAEGTTKFTIDEDYAANGGEKVYVMKAGSGTKWTPIGNATNSFQGTFDGNGKTISNLYVSSTSSYLGLFGAVGKTDTPGAAGYGVVKNFTIDGYVENTHATAEGTDYVGGVVGILRAGGTISDVTSNVDICAPKTVNVGGIAGFAGSPVGGAGDGTYTENPSGSNTLITKCANNGIVVGYYKNGGIVGELAALCSYCYNTGLIMPAMNGSGGGSGGIAGRNGNNNTPVEESVILCCYNTGTITYNGFPYGQDCSGRPDSAKVKQEGGIAGTSFGGGTGDYAALKNYIINCYSVGAIPTCYDYANPIVGRVDGNAGQFQNNYSLTAAWVKASGSGVHETGTKLSSADLAASAPRLNSGYRAFIADSTTNPINNGYPVLFWQSASYDPEATVASVAWSGEDTVKTSYVAGQTFDTGTLSMVANFSDGTQQAVTNFDITVDGVALTGPLTVSDNGKTVKVGATFAGVEYAKEYVVSVVGNTVSSIALYSQTSYTKPNLTTYQAGETLDLTGLKLNVTYSNGTVETVTFGAALPDGWTTNANTPLTDEDNGKVLKLTYKYEGVDYEYDTASVEGKAVTISIVVAPEQDETGAYLLKDAADLDWFATQVNNGRTTLNAKLASDIDLSGVAYTPIGTSTNNFGGTLDGNGKTITFSTTTTFNTTTSAKALILYLKAGTVKDLVVDGELSVGASSAPFIYTMYGKCTLSNLTNNANITSTGAAAGIVYTMGSYSLKCDGAVVSNCVNNGNITTNGNVAGISYSSSNCGTVLFENCVNNGNLKNTGASGQLGGIAGWTVGSAKNCVNNGNITGGTSSAVGGIFGYNYLSTATSVGIDGCANTGTLTGGRVGGLAGATYASKIQNSYNTGAIVSVGTSTTYGSAGLVGTYSGGSAGGTITNCYSTGTVTGSVNIGALVGYDTKGDTLTNCYYLEGVATKAWGGGAGAKTTGFTVKTADEMKADDFVTALGAAYKADGTGECSINGGYPVLTWQVIPEPEPEPEPTGYEWYGDGLATEYIISTAAELAAFANIVNGTVPEEISIAQDNFAGKTVTLANDIVLAEDNLYTVNENVSFGAGSYAMTADQYVVNADAPRWTPIGSGIATSNINATGNTFAGTFDGNGKTISGLYIGTGTAATANTNTVAGLFGIVSGTVKNVTVSGCITAKIVAGGVVAHLAGGTVSNCVNNVNLFADGGTTPNGNVENGVSRCGAVGGIVGIAADGSTITGCTNAGAIVCPNTNKGGRAGGILGLIDSGTIVVTGCSNSGLVSAYSYAGGIVGGNWSATSSIDSCSNTGHVVANTGGSGYAGGITAYAAGPISDCYNSGEISIIRLSGNKAGHFGGIVSDLVGASATVTNCYNTGALTFGGACTSWSSAGAIAGSGWTGKLTNCHYVANVTSAYGLTAADLTTSTSDVQTGDVVALVKGDVNNSGALNIVDAQLAYSYGAKKLSADTLAELMARWSNNEALAQTMFKAAADVNDDGAVDAGDAFAIQYALHHGGFETAGE